MSDDKDNRWWSLAAKDGRPFVLLTFEGGHPMAVTWHATAAAGRHHADQWAARQHRAAELWDIAGRRMAYHVAWDVRPRFVVPPVVGPWLDPDVWFPAAIRTVPT